MVYGIQINDKDNGVVSVSLLDILNCFEGKDLFWSILYLYSRGDLGEGKSIPEFEDAIEQSEKGILFTWLDLKELAGKFHEVWDLVLIGCQNQSNIRRYKSDEEMFANCEVVIEMVDSSYWLVHSHDENLIKKISGSFQEVEFLS